MPVRSTPTEAGSVIEALVSLIEAYAYSGNQGNKGHEMGTRLAILDAVTAELIWGLGSEYDTDLIITRHADNVAGMILEMNEFTEVFKDNETP